MQLDFKEIKGEKSRTYFFGQGKELTINNVIRLCIRPSGTHRIETAEGRKFAVPPRYIGVEIVADEWSL